MANVSKTVLKLKLGSVSAIFFFFWLVLRFSSCKTTVYKSSLLGGAHEGLQHLGPYGNIPNIVAELTGDNIPKDFSEDQGYPDPPNPCPIGKTGNSAMAFALLYGLCCWAFWWYPKKHNAYHQWVFPFILYDRNRLVEQSGVPDEISFNMCTSCTDIWLLEKVWGKKSAWPWRKRWRDL